MIGTPHTSHQEILGSLQIYSRLIAWYWEAAGCSAALGLTAPPLRRLFGQRPYTPGGPLFEKLKSRTWLATGGRKMGTILGAAFSRRLVEEELR